LQILPTLQNFPLKSQIWEKLQERQGKSITGTICFGLRFAELLCEIVGLSGKSGWFHEVDSIRINYWANLMATAA
jgi:hypothetical protein